MFGSRSPLGSPVVLFQEPRRLTTYMAAVSRRRRFTILILICCLSFFIFAWYSRMQDVQLSNDVLITDQNEISSRGEMPSSNKVHFSHVGKKVELNNNFDKIRWPQIPTSPPVQPPKDNNPLLPFHLEIENKPAGRFDENELFSGPTEYADFPVTKPFKRHPALELFSGPSDYEDSKLATLPSRRHPDVEMENSGPTEDDVLSVIKRVTPSLPNNEIPRPNKLVTKRYDSLSLEGTTPSGTQVTEPIKDVSLILDTPGCKIPRLDPWDPTVKDLIELQNPYECPGPPLFMRPGANGQIVLNQTILETYYNITAHELVCYYQPVLRKHEDPGNVRENDFTSGKAAKLQFGVSIPDDYVGAGCNMGNDTFQQYFPLVRLKPEIEEQRNVLTPPTPRLNIILSGIDSVSKLNFMRHFPQTLKVLNEKMTPFEMNGYTKVGDNTFPNLVPMLTGHFVEHYWNESLRDTMYFDDIDLIWKDYAKRGYRTFYAEDSPYTGTFNYLKRGFYDPPTDYYLRPLVLALEHTKLKENAKEHCLNSQLETDLLYDYMRNFVETMGHRPYIGFVMASTLTHDYLNHAGWADEPAAHLLEDLIDMGALNNSLLVLFSDHGLRFGKIRNTYIGKFEERMPFMYIHAPKWFLDQYPQIAKNLQTNQNRLMTLFDIHATMIHLLDLNKTPEERSAFSLGKSLLDEISPNRTCEEANILPHWCPCQTFEAVSVNSSEAINASQAMVDDINNKLQPFSGDCEVLEVNEIMDARVGQANDLVLRFLRHDNVVVNRTVVYGDKVQPIGDYMITLTTKPGGAVFEGTVRHDPQNNSYTVLGISRISLYGNTSWCIDSQKMKIYCYCKVQKT